MKNAAERIPFVTAFVNAAIVSKEDVVNVNLVGYARQSQLRGFIYPGVARKSSDSY